YSAANVVLGIGVTEFVPGVNDFNTAPPEKALMPTRRESAYAFGPEKLPERCTIRIAGTKGGKQMFEHRMRYDKRGLLPFDVTNVTATEDFKCLGAEVSLGEDRKGLLFELSLSDDSGKKAVSIVEKAASKWYMKLPLTGVAPGRYIFAARLLDEDKNEVQKISGGFIVFPEKPVWLGNRLGMSDGKVPAPWTPLEINPDNEVKCWGRTYRLDSGGLPKEIIGQNGVIAKNVRFTSGNAQFKPLDFKWETQAADKAVFKSTLGLNGHRIHITGTLEFDGMLWLEVDCIPEKGKQFPNLAFQYDAPEEYALLAYCGEHLSRHSGIIPKEGWSKPLLEHEAFWIGNDSAGLYFFADDLRGWNVKVLEDVKATAGPIANGRRIVNVPLLEKAVNKAGSKYHLEFGILATPSRPMPKGFRNWRINSGVDEETHHFYARGITKFFNAPIPLAQHANGNLDYWRKRNIIAPVYLAFLYLSPFCDEYRWFGKTWSGELKPSHRYVPENAIEHYLICPAAPGYNDYYIHSLDKMLTETKADGIYFDYMQPDIYRCKSSVHGCLWKRNGKYHSSSRLKASREWAKRVYILMKQHNPDGLVVFHDSSGFSPAVHSFCDVTWSGEHTTRRMFENNLSYHDIFELDKFRVELRHEPWGVPRVFLPQYLRAVSLWDNNRFGDAKKLGWNGQYKAFCNDPTITKD
ncbi:MAG: hypothetical protein J5746_12715, partial [Victivallales bacterium]|nr:hypothetical protein [Victivallales bacterium]